MTTIAPRGGVTMYTGGSATTLLIRGWCAIMLQVLEWNRLRQRLLPPPSTIVGNIECGYIINVGNSDFDTPRKDIAPVNGDSFYVLQDFQASEP